MKKKIFIDRLITVLLIFAILSALMGVISLAEGDEGVTDTPTGENVAVEENAGDTEYSNDLVGNIMKAFSNVMSSDFSKIAGLIFDVLVFILLSVLKRGNNKDLTALKENLLRSQKDVNEQTTEKFNELIESSNANSENIEKFKDEFVESVRQLTESYSAKIVTHEQMMSVVAGTRAVLEIIDTIYQHSSTIPAVIKEQITMLRSEAIKNFEVLDKNDEQV